MGESRPHVSVIIPAYNEAGSIGQLMQRLSQVCEAGDSGDCEVILVDDGSSDGSAEWAEAQSVVTHSLWQENRGVSAARNSGLKVSSCEWIAFLDSDDEWMPQKLERQIEALELAPTERVCHTDEIWIRNGRRVNPRQIHRKVGGWIFRHCLPRCMISPSSVLIHRDVFAEVGVFRESLPACEDYDLWLRLCLRYQVLYVDEPLITKYGGHADQLSRQPGLDRYRIEALRALLDRSDLCSDDRRALLETLSEKLGVYLAGVRKRGRVKEAENLEELRRTVDRELGARGDSS